MMIKAYYYESGDQLKDEMIKEVEEAARQPITFDEDCSELSPAMMKAFKCSVVQRNRKRRPSVIILLPHTCSEWPG